MEGLEMVGFSGLEAVGCHTRREGLRRLGKLRRLGRLRRDGTRHSITLDALRGRRIIDFGGSIEEKVSDLDGCYVANRYI